MLTTRHCDECGRRFQQQREHSIYCSAACRKTANERRISGGYKLYPLVMRWRIERPAEALNELCVEADRLANIEREIRATAAARRQAQDSKLPSERLELARQIEILEIAMGGLPSGGARDAVQKEIMKLQTRGHILNNKAASEAKRAKKEAA